MAALHDVVKAGKVRYLGASSMYAWQFAKAQYLAERHGWTRFATMQNHYNLLYREEEREMLPLCADQGVGAIPWSPLARGRLTRDWDASSARSETDEFGKTLYLEQRPADRRAGRRAGRAARGVAGPGRAGLGAAQSGGQRADRRRHQARAPRRRRRRASDLELDDAEVRAAGERVPAALDRRFPLMRLQRREPEPAATGHRPAGL